MTEEELIAAFERGLDERGVPVARARGGPARGRPRRRSAGSARSSSSRAVIPAYVEREFSFTPRRRPDPRPLGPRRHRARGGRPRRREPDAPSPAAATPTPSSPTLGLTGRERVTITDYKSSDVRDPVKARQRARESLQLQIYAMGYEALTGRLPDCRPAPLPRLRARRPGRGRPEAAREGAREDRRPRRPGMRARDYTPKPDRLACTLLPVPRDLPVERRDVTRDATSRRHPGDHVRLRQHARAGRPGGAASASSRRPASAVVERARAVRPRRVPARSGRRSASASSARRCRSSARSTSPSGSCGSSPGCAACRRRPRTSAGTRPRPRA